MLEKPARMHGLKMPHLDDFTLLRYVAGDLDDLERKRAQEHLGPCATCRKTLGEIEELDRELSALAKDGRRDLEIKDLPQTTHSSARRAQLRGLSGARRIWQRSRPKP